MIEAGSAVNGATQQGLRLLDKVTEFRFALVLMSVAIALDVALAWIANRSILTVDWSMLGAGGFAKLGLAAVIYVFWMAALSPLVRYVVEFFISWVSNTRFGCFFGNTVESEYETVKRRYFWGQVKVNDARLCALRDKDTFWITQVEKAEVKEREERKETEALASLSFSVVGLMLMDWYWRDFSIVGELLARVDGGGEWMRSAATLVVVICLFLILSPWLYRGRSYYPGDSWMDHPKLAKERLDAIDERMRDSRL